jgi:hypothetical protein
MTQSMSVRCPACRRKQSFTPPTFPCVCGAPLTLPVLRDGAPEEVHYRTWHDMWVVARCPSCGRLGDWPRPEFGCPCGAVVRVPVAPAPRVPDRGPRSEARPVFRPVAIRTARDAVTAAECYLSWLGFKRLQRPAERTPFGVDVRGRGVVAQVDPTGRPTGLRAVECLWLHGLHESAAGVFFSLPGYAERALERADDLCIALYVMNPTGNPEPVNSAADDLIRHGPPGA